MTMPHETTSSLGGRYGWKAVALGAACGALALVGPVQAADWSIEAGYETIYCKIINNEFRDPAVTFLLTYSLFEPSRSSEGVSYFCSSVDKQSVNCDIFEYDDLIGKGNGTFSVNRDVYNNQPVSDSDKPLICEKGFYELEIKIDQKW